VSALSKEISPAIAPPTAKRSGRGGRMLELDGYRGLAAIMIIVAHAWMQGGYPYHQTAFETAVRGFDYAVSLFFALSGMVTFLAIVRGALTGKVPSGREFFVRRLYRILPAYFLLIIAVWASRFAGTPTDFFDLLRHLTFTQVYDKTHIFWLDGPSWSLADEFHYYILIALLGPPLARIAARRSTTAKKLAVMATLPAAMLVASLTFTAIASNVMNIPLTDSWVYYNPLARADSFAEGMLLAILLSIPGVMKVRPKMALTLSTLGFVSIAVLWMTRSNFGAAGGYYFAIAGVSAALLLSGAAMLREQQALSKFLRSRVVQLWATVGLSLYLWHEPVMIQLARWHILYFIDPVAWPISTIGLIVASTLVAFLSYKLVEEPGARLQKLFADLRGRQGRKAPRRSGPPPRWLPDLVLAAADGTPVSLRELPRDRPLLLAFEHDQGERLAEQRFRLDAREADGFYVASTPDTLGPAGTTVLVDREDRLSAALNGFAALIEVSPGGLITAMHEPHPIATEVMS
jgi:peptidoglycan/LPS O-acetylase OafA/YrhL